MVSTNYVALGNV